MSTPDTVPATANARALAARLGVDLRTVRATGDGGLIDATDVTRAHQGRAAPAAAVSRAAPAAAGPYGAGSPLPAFTASGLDPKLLLNSPAPVRPVIAAAATTAEAYQIAQRYAGMSDEQAARVLATDISVPADLAYAWADSRYVEPGSTEATHGSGYTSTSYGDDGTVEQTARTRNPALAAAADLQRTSPAMDGYWVR